jgi:dolichol-phosphate mannosyltransferase
MVFMTKPNDDALIPYRRRPSESLEFGLEEYGALRAAVVVCARNERATIGAVVSDAAAYAHEVLVLDGRSTDGTPEAAVRAGAKVHQDPGLGKGSAVRLALELTSTDIVVFIDADGSHDPGEIPNLVRPIIRGEADLCVGSRFAGGSDELSVNLPQLVRTIGNISMNIAINARWGLRLTDTLNGFRAVRRQAARSAGLRENRHTIEQEMVMKMLRHGYRVINVPTHEYARLHGGSHINIWLEWPMFVWCVTRNIILKRPPRGRQPVSPESAAADSSTEGVAD